MFFRTHGHVYVCVCVSWCIDCFVRNSNGYSTPRYFEGHLGRAAFKNPHTSTNFIEKWKKCFVKCTTPLLTSTNVTPSSIWVLKVNNWNIFFSFSSRRKAVQMINCNKFISPAAFHLFWNVQLIADTICKSVDLAVQPPVTGVYSIANHFRGVFYPGSLVSAERIKENVYLGNQKSGLTAFLLVGN